MQEGVRTSKVYSGSEVSLQMGRQAILMQRHFFQVTKARHTHTLSQSEKDPGAAASVSKFRSRHEMLL